MSKITDMQLATAKESRTKESRLDLQFGFELEFLFAMRELDESKDSEWRYLLPEFFSSDAQDDLDTFGADFDPGLEEHRDLCQSAMIFRRHGVPVIMRLHAKSSKTIVNRWNLTSELCVQRPIDDEDISSWTDGKIESLQGWDFNGQELISPILKAPDTRVAALKCQSFSEIDKVLKAIRSPPSAPYVYIGLPEMSSLHVHIGLPLSTHDNTATDIPLPVLQHLAWIVVAYEDLITLLHHPERRGYSLTKSADHALSNRYVFRDRTQDVDNYARHHTCSKTSVFDGNAAFNQIFGEVKTHDDLSELMTNARNPNAVYWRQKFVNFSNLIAQELDSKPIKTVEFRQHHGTMDPSEIKEWVFFVTSLVRAAEKKANEFHVETPTLRESFDTYVELPNIGHKGEPPEIQKVIYEKAKYRDIWSKKKRTLRELFDLMDLPLERRKYWYARVQEYRSADYDVYREQRSCYSWCNGAPPRDSEGWEASDVIEKPWDQQDEDDVQAEPSPPVLECHRQTPRRPLRLRNAPDTWNVPGETEAKAADEVIGTIDAEKFW